MENVVVSSESGEYKGFKENDICVFRGIPYGEAPAGKLRFKYALPAKKHEGIFDATIIPPKSPQPHKKYVLIDENCLYLNIWTPKADIKKRPVMFYIHVGSFAGGSCCDPMIDGGNFAKNTNCVVVSVNFRLGALGFLDFSFLDESFKGNCGFSDVILALKWVRENIEFFGGDKDNVTVCGQSSGGTMAVALNCIPQAYPYFSKTVAMSAGPTLFNNKEDSYDTAKKFMDFMGFTTKEQLLTASAEEFTARQKEFTRFCRMGAGTFTAEVDGEMIKYHPIVAAAKGLTCKQPILMGTTREEMSFLFIKPLAKALDIDTIANAGIKQEGGGALEEIPGEYKRIYGRRWNKVMFSDMVFRMGCVWFSKTQSKNTQVWNYRFDFETATMKMVGLHSFHVSDVPFLFGNFNTFLGNFIKFFTSKKKIEKIVNFMQNDIKNFMEKGICGWESCSESKVPAKCYSLECYFDESMPPSIVEIFGKTKFCERSFSEDSGGIEFEK